ncbi:MAG: MATE family efflux transporter [Oscillospiraceae bacterium]|nr:MATE family efflux transporter [Oscillospiraceae bacterium]
MKKDMTSGVVWKQILLFALPVMAGNVLQQLYITVDGIIVGKYIGEAALSSVGLCQPLTMFWQAIAIGTSIGAGVVVSQYFGAKRKSELPLVIDTALTLLAILGVVCTVLALLTSKFFLRVLLGVPEHLLGESLIYYRIFACSMFFCFLYNAASFVLRGVGDSNSTMYFLLVTTVMNIGLDLLFVAVFHWGVAGAAVATLIAQAVCFAVSYWYLRRYFSPAEGRHFDSVLCRLMLKLGIPAAAQQCVVALGNIAMQRLVNSFGQASIAAYTASQRVDSFVFFPIFGYQTALSNFTGQNIGAGKLDRVKRGLVSTLIMAAVTALVICVLLYTLAPNLVSFFSLTGEASRRGILMIRFIAKFFIVFAVYMSFCGVLQGAGDVAFQSGVSFTALFTRAVLGYVGVAVGILGYNAAWVPTPIGWGIALIMAVTRYISGRWKTKAVTKASAADPMPPEQE